MKLEIIICVLVCVACHFIGAIMADNRFKENHPVCEWPEFKNDPGMRAKSDKGNQASSLKSEDETCVNDPEAIPG